MLSNVKVVHFMVLVPKTISDEIQQKKDVSLLCRCTLIIVNRLHLSG